MWPLPTTWIWAGALAAAVGAAGVQTVRLAWEREGRAQDQREAAMAGRRALEQAMEDRDAAQVRADTAARAFEAWQRLHAPRVAAVKKEVQDAAQTDVVCRDRPLPDGLRDALRRAPAAVGASDASEPGSVPSVGPR